MYLYLRAMLLLAIWADDNGYGLTLDEVLGEDLVWSFLKQQDFGAIDYEPYLWRLALARHPISDEAARRASIPRPKYLEPYSDDELEQLVRFASSLTNKNRRETLLTIIVLGAGCGIVRTRMAGVTAKFIHRHGDETFVAVGEHCAKVSPDFVALLTDVATFRSSGPLVPSRNGNLTQHATAWVKGRRGVPELSVDRLRATYVVRLLNDGTSLMDILEWTGMKKVEALQGYLPYVRNVSRACSRKVKVKN
jgi:hypothetical protein